MTYLLKGDYILLGGGSSSRSQMSHPALEVAKDATINLPSDAFFLEMGRGDDLLRRFSALSGEWALIQDLGACASV
jgi:hypothetical protein